VNQAGAWQSRTFTGLAPRSAKSLLTTFSPDGQILFVGANWLAAGSPRISISRWDIASGKRLYIQNEAGGSISSMGVVQDERQLALKYGYYSSCYPDTSYYLMLINAHTGKSIAPHSSKSSLCTSYYNISNIVFSPDNQWTLATTFQPSYHSLSRTIICNTKTGQEYILDQVFQGDFTFTLDNKLLVTNYYNTLREQHIQVLDIPTLQKITEYRIHLNFLNTPVDPIHKVIFSPNKAFVATVTERGMVQIWQVILDNTLKTRAF
jgi:WD40 repeat protein